MLLVSLVLGATVFSTGALAAVPENHPVHKAPRGLMNRIASSDHAVASPFHHGHYVHKMRNSTGAYANGGLRVTPADFGGDPTGVKDSTKAVQQCISKCLEQSELSPNGLFPGSTSFGNGMAVRDMGGCFVDLAGGEYVVSEPIVIPEYNANMNLGFGSLVASKDFAPGALPNFVIVIGVKGSCKVPQGSCNVDLNFPELFIDGSHVASAVQINNVMGVTIGPGGYFLNFTDFGIQINGGHEVMVDRCWLGETNFDFDYIKFNTVPNATAIQINGNDHYILNTIVFSSRVGLEVNGAADYITGTHVWFPDNKALNFKDSVNAMAFHITAGGNRFNGCYMDGGRAVLEGGGLSKNIWTNGFECCGYSGAGEVPHGLILAGDNIGPGLEITHNLFNGGSIWHEAGPSRWSTPRTNRFHGNDAVTCNASSFEYDLKGKQCDGLTAASEPWAHDNVSACVQACCDHAKEGQCDLYQWSPVADGGGCWYHTNGGTPTCGPVRNAAPWTGASMFPPSDPSTNATVIGTRIEDNYFAEYAVASRTALSRFARTPTKVFYFDFCSALIFPKILSVRSLTVRTAGPSAGEAISVWAETPVGCNLTVNANVAFVGTVFAEVDTSTYGGNFL